MTALAGFIYCLSCLCVHISANQVLYGRDKFHFLLGGTVQLSHLIQNYLGMDGSHAFGQLTLHFLRFWKMNHYFDGTFLLYRRPA